MTRERVTRHLQPGDGGETGSEKVIIMANMLIRDHLMSSRMVRLL